MNSIVAQRSLRVLSPVRVLNVAFDVGSQELHWSCELTDCFV